MLVLAFVCFFALLVAWLLAPNAPAQAEGAPATDNRLDTTGSVGEVSRSAAT